MALKFDTYVEQQIGFLELESYAFNEIVLYLQKLLKPDTVKDYAVLMDMAHALWYRVGRGTTLLTEIPLEEWIRHA